MSYKRFDKEDIVISAESITAPAWRNNTTTLTSFTTSSSQIAGSSGDFYFNVFDTADTTDVQFTVAYGNRVGSGSIPFNSTITSNTPSRAVYGQYRTLINGDENTDFSINSTTPDSVFFISLERSKYKEKILPGSLTLKVGDSSTAVLTDNSKNTITDTFSDAGRVYSIYSGSQGVVDNTTIEYGKIYPDVGIIALSGDVLQSENLIQNITLTNTNADNHKLLVDGLNVGGGFTVRSEETLSSNLIFLRVRNSEFNYSTNPSNLTGSGELLHSVMVDTPQAYITSVGLYNDNNDLLATAKLSKPLLKDFTKELYVEANE